MTENKLSIKEVISNSWAVVKSNYSLILLSLAIYILILGIIGALEMRAGNIVTNNKSSMTLLISFFYLLFIY